MRPRIVAATLASFVVASLAFAAAARADEQTRCAATLEGGRVAKESGRLRDARALLLACVEDTCAPAIREACAKSAVEVLVATPSFLVDVHTADARGSTDVRVLVDGEVVANALDDHPIPVDPGTHSFRFEREGYAPVTVYAVIDSGVKRRLFMIEMERVRRPEPPPIAPEPRAVRPPDRRGPIAFMAAGAGAASIGIALIAFAPSFPSNCSRDTGRCTQPRGETSGAFAQDLALGAQSRGMTEAGIVTSVIGASMATAGLVWYVAQSATAPKRVGIVTPWLGAGAGGAAASGSF